VNSLGTETFFKRRKLFSKVSLMSTAARLEYVIMQLTDKYKRDTFLRWSYKEVPRLIYTLETWLYEFELDHIPFQKRPKILKEPYMVAPQPKRTNIVPVVKLPKI
jgi:hypothetical protein